MVSNLLFALEDFLRANNYTAYKLLKQTEDEQTD